jgi:hypothetical protein
VPQMLSMPLRLLPSLGRSRWPNGAAAGINARVFQGVDAAPDNSESSIKLRAGRCVAVRTMRSLNDYEQQHRRKSRRDHGRELRAGRSDARRLSAQGDFTCTPTLGCECSGRRIGF